MEQQGNDGDEEELAHPQPSTLVMMILSLSRDLLCYFTIELIERFVVLLYDRAYREICCVTIRSSLSRDLLCYYTIELVRVSKLISAAEFFSQRNKEVLSRYRQHKMHLNSIFSEQCCKAAFGAEQTRR